MSHVRGLAAFALALLLTGCGTPAAVPTATPAPPPTATPTPVVTFAVQLTAIPATATPGPSATALPTPPPHGNGPYVVPHPAYGPPLSRAITVSGGNFPPHTPVQLFWSPNGRDLPIQAYTQTDARGRFSGMLTVPASAPGRYFVIAEVQGVRYASATYHVVSAAVLTAQVTQGGTGNLVVTGTGFLPNLSLTLIAYPEQNLRRYVILGTVRASSGGHFSLVHSTPRLAPGQYILRAYARGGLAAQMAETFFQVVL